MSPDHDTARFLGRYVEVQSMSRLVCVVFNISTALDHANIIAIDVNIIPVITRGLLTLIKSID